MGKKGFGSQTDLKIAMIADEVCPRGISCFEILL